MKIANTKTKRTSNLFVDMIYFIATLSMRVFDVTSKEALPKRRISINVVSSVFVKELLISLTVL